ncbi:peptidoglycan-recognition protein LA-like [Periplaneta americana]|uniref:peptidoglycan-recognition protein LA-like n=1 Tax=Periplaneta americana TaxID=6978 RepID=UPI0037E74C9A
MSVDDDERRTNSKAITDAESGTTDSDVGVDGCCRGSSSEDEDNEYEGASTRKASEVSAAIMEHPAGVTSNIHMENSSDVQIGPRLHYNAPVTINQYVSVLGNGEPGGQDGVVKQAITAPMQGLDQTLSTSNATIIGSDEKLHGVVPTFNGVPPRQSNNAASDSNRHAAFCFKRRFYLVAMGVSALLIVVLTILIVHFSSSASDKPSRDSVTFNPPPAEPTPNPNNTLSSNHTIYSKEDWFGAEPRYVRQLRHPTIFVVISHTVTPACYTPVKCSAQMRSIQDYHMGNELELPDIGYSFVIGGDGNVYEGRGWDATNMHTGFVKRCNIGISLIGNFVHDTPTNGQLEALKDLIELGVKLEKIDQNYKLVPMNETYDTMSPGPVLYGIIKKWPHFWTATKDDIGVCPYIV